MDWRGSRPSVGTGSLELAGQRWPCYYRAQYENWRKVNYVPNRTFWPVLVYCPSPDYQSSCSSIDKYFRKNKSNKLHDASLSLHLSSLNPNKLHTALTASFQLVVNRWTAEVKEKQRMAICVPIPYLMEEQQLASGQLIRDFVRYYSKLGIKVFMYDSFGKASKYIFGTADTLFGNSKSSYSESAQTVGDKLKVDPRGGIVGWQQEQQLGEQLNLVYHDYTIMGLLDPTMESFKSIFGHSEWQTTTDSDKVLTLTHCRFEAQEIFGIDRVFVADFDEFFFCPNAKSNMELLSQIINEKADEYERKGNDQILYKQVWVANKTEVVFDCVNEQLRNKRSMYDCFAPTQFPVSNHGVKPLHIGHRCPLTSYHEACDEDRRYNCACESLTTAPCAFIHFSLRNKKYAWRWWRQKHNAHLFVDKSIEIKDMLLQDGVLSIPRTLLTSAREYDVNIAPA